MADGVCGVATAGRHGFWRCRFKVNMSVGRASFFKGYPQISQIAQISG